MNIEKSSVPVENGVCVVTAYDDAYAVIGNLTARVNRLYCTRNHYDIRVHRDGFDTSRAMTWNKVPLIRQALQDYEWVFWIDADAMFTNHTIRIESLTQIGGDFFICRDVPMQNKLNAGVMIFRHCDFNFWLLDEIWKREDLANTYFYEQTALNDLHDAGRLGGHIVQHPIRAFNSFTFVSLGMSCGAPVDDYKWAKGDFIAHCPGRNLAEKFADLVRVASVCRNEGLIK